MSLIRCLTHWIISSHLQTFNWKDNIPEFPILYQTLIFYLLCLFWTFDYSFVCFFFLKLLLLPCFRNLYVFNYYYSQFLFYFPIIHSFFPFFHFFCKESKSQIYLKKIYLFYFHLFMEFLIFLFLILSFINLFMHHLFIFILTERFLFYHLVIYLDCNQFTICIFTVF
jgi:hypothetical protein